MLALHIGPAAAEPYVFSEAWTDSPVADVMPGGTLSYPASSDPRTFNPLTSFETNIVVDVNTDPAWGAAVLGWRRPGDYVMEPRAAENWSYSEDGLTLDVHLRPELRWSDGTPITSQDYLLSFELQANPEIGLGGPEGWLVDGEPIEMELTSERSLRIRFPGHDRFTPLLLESLYPLPDRIFGEAYRAGGAEAVNALWGTDTAPQEIVFSGYLRLVEFRPGERVVFERNPYFGEWNVDATGRSLPYVDGVVFSQLDPDAALNSFLAGELDGLRPRGLDDISVIRAAMETDGLEALVVESAFPLESTFFITFNWNLASDPFKQELFRNPTFRRAIAHLVDRQAIVDLVYDGAGFPLTGAVHPSYVWYDAQLEAPGFDPAKAAELLAAIGFTSRDRQGYLVDGEGRRAGFALHVAADNPPSEGTAIIVADVAREVGVEVEIRPVTFPLLVDLVTSSGEDRPFEAVFLGLTAADHVWPINEDVYSCAGPFHFYNRSGMCLFAAEHLLGELAKRGRTELDDSEAMRIAFEAQALDAQLNAMIYTAVPAAHFVSSGRVAGHFPTELWGPHYGFGLTFLNWVRSTSR